MKLYLEFWKNAFNFTGETTRYTYWYIQLINWIIFLVLVDGMFLGMMGSQTLTSMRIFVWLGIILIGLFMIGSVIPKIAMSVRRLRNAGLPWALIILSMFNTVFKILMLLPAKVKTVRMERKERFVTLSVLSIVISLVGLLLLSGNDNVVLPTVVVSAGLLVGIIDLILNMKRRRIFALSSLVVALISMMFILSNRTITQFNDIYEKSDAVLAMDRVVYDALNQESLHDGRPVNELKIVEPHTSAKINGVLFEVISTEEVTDDYIRVALNIQNTGKQDLDLSDLNFELANSDTTQRMLQYDPYTSPYDLEAYNFRFVKDQVVMPGETIKGTVAFLAPMTDASYLVVGEPDEREVAFELQH